MSGHREEHAQGVGVTPRAPKARLGMGLVGPGFVGVHHVDAVRRLGFVDVVAVADVTEASAASAAAAMHVPTSYGSIEALVANPAIDVIHVTTPNHLHAPVTRAAIAHGKHVISEKPLAMSAAEARDLVERAEAAGIVHAVSFNYRGNPMVQQVRQMVAAGVGITLLPMLATRNPVPPAQNIHLLAFSDSRPSRQIALLWRKTSALGQLLHQVADICRGLPDDLLTLRH